MSFMKEVIQRCDTLWQGYLKHPFIDDIRHDCMDKNMFEHYLIQDSLYLHAYAKVFAMGIYKSTSMAQIRLFYDLLSGVVVGESAGREDMLAQMHYDVEGQGDVPCDENQAYIAFMMNTAKHEGIVEILFATLPCMLSYAYIGCKLVEENPNIIKENSLGSWIEEYACDSYIKKCREWSMIADTLCEHYEEAQRQHLCDLFYEASVHEMHFWDMSYHYQKEEQ